MACRCSGLATTERNAPAGRRVWVSLLAVAVSVSGACASIRHPRPQTVGVHSCPSGADVFIGERRAGVTPVEIVPNRRVRKTVLRLEKDGFAPGEVRLHRSLSRSLLGDLVFPGVVSAVAGQAARRAEIAHVFAGTLAFMLGIDFLTGTAFRFPGSVRATLTRSPAGETGSAAENVRKRNRVLPTWLIEKGARFSGRGKP